MAQTTQPRNPNFSATGKRKRAVARVYLYNEGKGEFQVNTTTLETYFPRATAQMIIKQPLILTKTEGKFDIYVNVCGGGKSGQAEAVRHGLSRALLKFNPELRKTLKAEHFLTRDAREVERKKSGMSGARKRYQYSKR